MKKLTILIILALLSACQPRDVKVVPDEMRNRNFGKDSKDGGFFLRDEVLAAHMVERELEALSVLESEGFEKFVSKKGEATFVKAEPGVELVGNLKSSTTDYWYVDQNGEKFLGNSVALVSDPNGLIMKLYESKKLFVEGKLDSDFSVKYSLVVDAHRKGPKYWDNLPMKIEIDMKVRKEDSKFVVLESSSRFEVKKVGDDKFSRTLVVKSDSGFNLLPGTCPSAEGRLALYRFGKDKQTGTLEFSKDQIRETSRDWKEDLIDCSKKRPLLDLSRLLR